MTARFLPCALLLLGACTIDPGNSGSPEASSNPANASSSESAKGGATGSSGSKGGATTNGSKNAATANGSKEGAAANSAAGRTGTQPDGIASSGSAGEGEGELDPPADASTGGQAGMPPAPCDLEGHCDPKTEDKQVTCAIVPGNECEFNGFVGATAQVSLGQRAVIGTACCGACECVPIEVYFDGEQCWQGISRCNIGLLNPHPTTTPNPAFTPPTNVYGSFYLGSAGSEGREAAAGGGGASGASGASGAYAAAGTGTSSQGGSGGAP